MHLNGNNFFTNYIDFIVMKITITFTILNTNTIGCHFIFFTSPFQTDCFRNFSPEFPGVKPLLVLIHITHQELS